jgi:hypothetical protein
MSDDSHDRSNGYANGLNGGPINYGSQASIDGHAAGAAAKADRDATLAQARAIAEWQPAPVASSYRYNAPQRVDRGYAEPRRSAQLRARPHFEEEFDFHPQRRRAWPVRFVRFIAGLAWSIITAPFRLVGRLLRFSAVLAWWLVKAAVVVTVFVLVLQYLATTR